MAAYADPSIYQFLNPQQVTPLDPLGAMQQGQRSAFGQMAFQEARRQQQVEEQTRALYRQHYGQGGTPAGPQAGMVPQAGAVQETVNTPYSSDLQAMLSQYQQEGADVTPQPGARVLPGAGPQGLPGQARAGVDTQGLVRALYQIDPKAAQAAEKAAQDSQIGQLEMVGKQNAMVSQVARSILLQDTQQAYEVGVGYLRQAGIPVDHLPPIYDRRLVEHYYGMSTDAETRVKEAQARLVGTQATLAPRKLAVEERDAARLEQAEERLQAQYELDVQRLGIDEAKALLALRTQRLEEEQAATQTPEYIKGEGDRNAILSRMMRERGLTGSPPADVLRAAEDELIAQQGMTEGVKTRQREQAELESKRPALQRKVQMQLGQLERQWQTVDEDIDRVLSTLDTAWGQTGIWGAAVVPGTPAYDVRQSLETIRANIGFDRLQQMREASPTGGALGQISDSENRLLQATAGSLDPKQSKEQLRQNLQRIKADIAALRTDRRQAFESEFRAAAPTSGRPPMPGGTKASSPQAPLPRRVEEIDRELADIERQLGGR